MKKFAVATCASIAFLLLAFAPNAELPLGAPIPKADLKLKDVSGREITLSAARKKNGLLVMFSCNTCPYVIKNQSRTASISNYALQKEVGVILLNSNEAARDGADSYEAMKKYAVGQKYNWIYAVDEGSVLADAFGASRTPETYLFDGEGKLVYRGAIDDNPTDESSVNRHHLKEAINELLAGKDISVKTSRSVGCSIKRL
ncbi:MAG TPA: thioredoxin family protein [Flavisolibacter sp.]|jgi:cytochrome oxidase Cu insertion factor (SCO1/SenC/PrrC family)|nr:thioredoxin family protein [Flavisolibacter sp.]